ncbi:MAG TPA: MarR family transcriptional regulator [Pyrinomonadaceae bacterium]|nr:MarR family transcriptional regulator [Pyrinomonadaceae bacterium]
MTEATPPKVEEVLSRFADAMSRLLVEQHQQHVAELDLTLLQAQALKLLRSAPMPTGQMAAELKISAPAITQLTDRLLRKGLIERRAMDGDRRCVLVALSVKGKKLVDQFRKRRCRIFSDALTSMEEEDQTLVVEALSKVVAFLEAYEAKVMSEKALL